MSTSIKNIIYTIFYLSTTITFSFDFLRKQTHTHKPKKYRSKNRVHPKNYSFYQIFVGNKHTQFKWNGFSVGHEGEQHNIKVQTKPNASPPNIKHKLEIFFILQNTLSQNVWGATLK